MRDIQNLFEAELNKIPYRLLAELVRRKFALSGHPISERTSNRIVKELATGKNSQVREWQFWRNQRGIELSDDDKAELEKKIDDVLGNKLPEMIKNASDVVSNLLLKNGRKTWLRMLKRERRDREAFERRLNERWGEGIISLQILLGLSREFGQEYSKEVIPQLRQHKPYLADVLLRSQARACQITEAIIVLLQHGFADDAMARWRSIHEIAATLALLTEHGEGLAERYVLHQHIEVVREANDYKSTEPCGYEPIDPERLESISLKKKELIYRFGSRFSGRYGWAAEHLEILNRDPTFRDIEQAAGIATWRATYGMASRSVHASSKSAYFRLGLLNGNDLALAGPTNAGLADPGHATALGLLSVNMCLFPFFETLDSHVFAKVMSGLAVEIGEEMMAAHHQLEEEEGRLVSSARSVK